MIFPMLMVGMLLGLTRMVLVWLRLPHLGMWKNTSFPPGE